MKKLTMSRRVFLGGAGALVALPLFDSLAGRGARADNPAPLRFLAYYVPCGIHMPNWTPATTGTGFDLPPILAPLASLKKKLLVLTGLANTPAIPDQSAGHATGTGSFLTARHPVKTEGPDIKNGVSVDQVAAAQLGKSTRIPSMQLGVDGGSSTGGCETGYSCAYARNISWASDTQPLPKTVVPQVVFDELFGGVDPAATAAEKAKRAMYRSSVLDYAMADAKQLNARLGATDRQKLDQYLTSVFELEQKIQKPTMGPQCPHATAPKATFTYPEHVQIMSDLMLLAMRCDATRVLSFMLGNAASDQPHAFIGVPESHHEISHHQNLQANFDKLTTIDTWEMQQLAYLLQAMDAIPEGSGTMLDNSVVFFSSEIEDGNAHRHTNLPVLLAGGCGGAFKTGRHLAYDGDPPIADLYISLLGALGIDVATFGDNGTGPLAGLSA